MPSSTSYRSAWALTILSLLFERDMHPYEMRRLVQQRGKGDLVDLRPGSLYRTIERLERAHLIESVETTREGKFPERTVYRITEKGRDDLLEWLRDLLSTLRKDHPELLQAVAVLPILEQPDAQIQLEGRLIRLEGDIAGMEAEMRRLHGVLPRLFQLEDEYALALRRAELAWVRALVDDLRTGRLAWTHEQIRRDYGDLGQGRPLNVLATEDRRMD